MAGTVTITEEYFARKRQAVCKCVSDSSGNVSGTGFQVQGGDLYGFTYLPVSGCTDGWNVTVTHNYKMKDGTKIQWADVLGGQGASLSNSTNGDHVVLSEPYPLLPGAVLTPVITGLGNAQTVYIVFDIWEEI